MFFSKILGIAMFFVYCLSSQRNGTLYIGVTNDLRRRLDEHVAGRGSHFVAKYRVLTLVWFEIHARIDEAIAREKQLKGWNRKWKLKLIESGNPDWLDVSFQIPDL
jgi:putative endonuclease